jgi:pilus assembly protein CpaB
LNNKFRGGLLLVIGFMLIVMGITAAYLLTREGGVLSKLTTKPTPVNVITNQVVAVNRDMKLGDLINLEDVKIISVPVDVMPRDSLVDTNAAVGKFLKTDMIQGEMLLSHNLADPTNVNKDLAFALTDEQVLMAISIDDVMTKESVIKRGDIIDVFVTITETVDNVATTTTDGNVTAEDQTTTQNPGDKVPRSFTFDAFQKTNVTGIVMDVITDNSNKTNVEALSKNEGDVPRQNTIIRAYLLALSPQDALVLKHLKDSGAIFDLVLRSPTSLVPFELTPVTQEYIVEFYSLQILK